MVCLSLLTPHPTPVGLLSQSSCRVVLRKKVQRRAREHQAMVKALMSSLEQADGDDALTGNKIRKCRELAFVTTDLLVSCSWTFCPAGK